MLTVEQVPRLSVAAIRQTAFWEQLREQRGGVVALETPAGEKLEAKIALTSDETSIGTRWWFRCACGTRRRHLHLLDGRLACRACHHLTYLENTWPCSRWREDVGRPILRAWRRLKRDKMLPAVSVAG